MPAAINERAQKGYVNAAAYDKHRPSYPADAVSGLLQRLNVAGKEGARIVELGAGTGKFTELLAARPEKFTIIAVEPQDNMRGELTGKKLPGVTVLQGDAANADVEDGWADAVVAAQAFHWFSTKETLKTIHRILRPGGLLGLIWNMDYYNSPKVWPGITINAGEQALKDLHSSYEDGYPRFRHLKWKEVFEQEPKLFSLPLNEDDVRWTRTSDDEGIWKRFATSSIIENYSPEKREEVKKELLKVLSDGGIERNEKGEVVLHGLTYFVWTSKI